MSKLVVKNTEGMKTPFLRGILTSSLLDSGVSFETAYNIASNIRQLINFKSEISTTQLREIIIQQLKESPEPQTLNRYLSVSKYSSLMIRRVNCEAEPFSRTRHRLCLESCGLSSDDATAITMQMYTKLLNQGKNEISGQLLGRETYLMLHKLKGSKVANRYLIWSDFIHSGRPLILLIGGTSGVGKSTIATEVGHRVGIVRTQSTDMLREVMRLMTPRALSPVLHTSSYSAWKALPDIDKNTRMTEKLLISGYLRQTELLTVACDGIITRALKEKVSLILEGVHIHPYLLEKIPVNSEAIVVPIILSVLKASELKEHIKGRGASIPDRLSTDYLDNFNSIWELQSYLMAEADKHDLPIVSNINKEKAIQEVMKSVIDAIFPYFSHDLDSVFPDES